MSVTRITSGDKSSITFIVAVGVHSGFRNGHHDPSCARGRNSGKLLARRRCCMKWIARVWPYALVAISVIGLVYMALTGRL